MQGFLNINKPSGMTSAAVVNKIKRQFNIKKIGHMGTLDPMASGVLVIAVEKATKLFDELLEKTKQYVAVFSFGAETDTLDAEGQVVNTTKHLPTKQEVEKALIQMVGKQDQLPPKYSAKKVNGKKAYELARSGQEFTLKPKEIELVQLKLLQQLNKTDFEIFITCSSGTYIRSVGRDLAYKLNSLATMTKLTRTSAGVFSLEESVNLEGILLKNSLKYDIIKIENVLPYATILVNESDFFKLNNGMTVACKKTDGKYIIKMNETLLGIGKVQQSWLKIVTHLLEN